MILVVNGDFSQQSEIVEVPLVHQFSAVGAGMRNEAVSATVGLEDRYGNMLETKGFEIVGHPYDITQVLMEKLSESLGRLNNRKRLAVTVLLAIFMTGCVNHPVRSKVLALTGGAAAGVAIGLITRGSTCHGIYDGQRFTGTTSNGSCSSYRQPAKR